MSRTDGETDADFSHRAEGVIPSLRQFVALRHPRRNLRAVIRFAPDMSEATVEVSALKDGLGL